MKRNNIKLTLRITSRLLLIGFLAFSTFGTLHAQNRQRYKIGVIDLMMLKRQKLGAVPLTREVGADGLEIDMGGLGNREAFDSKLSDTAVQRQYKEAAKKANIEFCSVGMTGFYSQSFAERPTYERMVRDCINTMKVFNVKVGFLPLGVKGDLVANPHLRPAVVERLKVVGKMAKKAGVVIGIETALSAEEEVKLLKDIGSKHIKIYMNFSNAIKNNRDLYEEIRILGKHRICQIHCSNGDGVWLQNDPQIDMKKVKETLDAIKWSGWLVIERSRDSTQVSNVKYNFSGNAAYMKSIFQ